MAVPRHCSCRSDPASLTPAQSLDHTVASSPQTLATRWERIVTQMDTKLCRMLGIEFPLFAFSQCRDVVAAVSRAGGFGVVGASSYPPEQIEPELSWTDAHIDGKPYGVDLLIPETLSIRTESGATLGGLA